MKKNILILCSILLLSCSKKEGEIINTQSDSSKIIDSLNAVRSQINDSIKLKNEQNRFADLSGNHQLKFSSDAISSFTGSAKFEKIGRDEYSVSGKAASGKNTLTIEGKISRVSDKHLNFEGKINQNIQGEKYTRTKKTTFFDEGKGKFWRLQDKVNSSGFVDYIDIYF